MPPPVTAPVWFFLLVYFALRYDQIENIWEEKISYEQKIERQLASFITDFLQPFYEDFNELMAGILPEPFQNGGTDFEEIVEEDDDIELDADEMGWSEMFATLGAIMPSGNDGGTSPQEAIEELNEGLSDLMGFENPDQMADYEEPLEVRYMVEQSGINPEEVFEEVTELYVRYVRPSRILKWLKMSLIGLIAFTGTLAIMSIFSMNLPANGRYTYVAILLGWIGIEGWMYITLSREVAVESFVDKILKIDMPNWVPG